MRDAETDRTEEMSEEAERLCIVGVGASAGGLEAIREMLAGASPDTNLAYVVIQHLDPNHESLLAELLARFLLRSQCCTKLFFGNNAFHNQKIA